MASSTSAAAMSLPTDARRRPSYAPFGEWELALPNTEEMRKRFTAGDIEDVLFVITWSGRTHEWPA